MVQITYQISINPRYIRLFDQAGNEAGNQMADAFLNRVARRAREEMQNQAPERTGRLRSGILITRKKKSGGGLDRRANIRVSSTAAHTRYVIAGARPSIGDGTTPGSGAYVGPAASSSNWLGRGGTKTFQASRGFKGAKGYRSKTGKWPGFAANDFVTRAERVLKPEVEEYSRFEGIKTYSKSFRGLA